MLLFRIFKLGNADRGRLARASPPCDKPIYLFPRLRAKESVASGGRTEEFLIVTSGWVIPSPRVCTCCHKSLIIVVAFAFSFNSPADPRSSSWRGGAGGERRFHPPFFRDPLEEEKEEEEEVGSLTETRSTGRRVGGLRYIRGAQFKPT